MIHFKLLPSFLRELVQHFPTLAFEMIDWKEILEEIGPIVKQLGRPQLKEELIHDLETNLDKKRVQLIFQQVRSNKTQGSRSIQHGQNILHLYFSQFKNASGVVLDIRSRYFTIDQEQTCWKPAKLYYQFSTPFKLALIDLYKGFYYEEDDRFHHALIEVGLAGQLNDAKKQELSALFKNYFGSANQESVHFDIKEFQGSFHEVFKFCLKEKVTLHKDFIFLGLYLVTLYLHLQKYEQSFDVKKEFLAVFPKNH
jgi:hypothetical protein